MGKADDRKLMMLLRHMWNYQQCVDKLRDDHKAIQMKYSLPNGKFTLEYFRARMKLYDEFAERWNRFNRQFLTELMQLETRSETDIKQFLN